MDKTRLSVRQTYFDQLAATWDRESRVTPEKIKEILSYARIRPGERVLDAGCGTGILLPFLRGLVGPGGKVYALDLSEKMLAEARSKFPYPEIVYLLAPAEDIPLPEACCEAVVCFSAFPHFVDKPRAVREMARVLRPGGRMLIAHAQGRGAVNRRHAQLGGALAEDLLPDAAEMRRLLAAAGLREVTLTDREDLYLLLATLSPSPGKPPAGSDDQREPATASARPLARA